MSRLVLSIFISLSGCAYHFGAKDRVMPGGLKFVYIPMFENRTMESSLEVPFTNALIREIERSGVVKVVGKNQADAIVVGVLKTISFSPDGIDKIENFSISPGMKINSGSFLASKYRVLATAEVVIKNSKDDKVIWQGTFDAQRTYSSAKVTLPSINTVNPLYNQSARYSTVESMAHDMMLEAHDRMTESF